MQNNVNAGEENACHSNCAQMLHASWRETIGVRHRPIELCIKITGQKFYAGAYSSCKHDADVPTLELEKHHRKSKKNVEFYGTVMLTVCQRFVDFLLCGHFEWALSFI